ncbi:hypothetical protein HK097_002407, partial [Rhizophlyctis rosea]
MGVTQLLMRLLWSNDPQPARSGPVNEAGPSSHSLFPPNSNRSSPLPPETPGRLSEDEEGFPTPPTPMLWAAEDPLGRPFKPDTEHSRPASPDHLHLPAYPNRSMSAASIESSDIPEPIVPPDTSTVEEVEAEIGGPVHGGIAISDNDNEHPPLLWESVAYAISSLATTARISLRAAALVAETALEGAKYGTTVGFGIGRTALVGALMTARSVHGRVKGVPGPVGLLLDAEASGGSQSSESRRSSSDGSVEPAPDSRPEHLALFHNALEKYTNMGIHWVNDGFTLAELFTLSTFHLTSKTVQFSFNAASETVGIMDGLFGSTETSRALAAFVHFTRRELNDWNNGQGALPGSGIFGKTWGTIALLGGLSKAFTAFACLQYMTHKRTLEARKVTSVWEGLVDLESGWDKGRKRLGNGKDGEGVDEEGEELMLKWSEEESTALLVEIEEMKGKADASRGKGKAVPDNVDTLLKDARAWRNGVETVEDARSFIEEARSIREGMDTVDDADSLISDARSVRSHMTDTASLYTAYGSEYGPETPLIAEEEEEETKEFLWNLAQDFTSGRAESPFRGRTMEVEEEHDAVSPMEVDEMTPTDERVVTA